MGNCCTAEQNLDREDRVIKEEIDKSPSETKDNTPKNSSIEKNKS